MSMIDRLTQDLLDKVRTVPELEFSTLITVGGVVEDRKVIPLPASRILYLGDHEYEDASPNTPRPYDSAIIHLPQITLSTFVVLVMFAYTDDDYVINTGMPMLEAVKLSAHGKAAPNGHQWRDIGVAKAFVYPDRIGYEQRFSIIWALGA